MIKECPINFSGPMVNAILEGRKIQTRRIVKLSKSQARWLTLTKTSFGDIGLTKKGDIEASFIFSRGNFLCNITFPFGGIGSRLWAKETWQTLRKWDFTPPSEIPKGEPIDYVANAQGDLKQLGGINRPSIFMRQWMSRITLEITNVRVERLNDISEEDARAEGCQGGLQPYPDDDPTRPIEPQQEFKELWQSIHGKGSWESNPWVWVIEFKVL